jgi:hypothetical protein
VFDLEKSPMVEFCSYQEFTFVLRRQLNELNAFQKNSKKGIYLVQGNHQSWAAIIKWLIRPSEVKKLPR